MIRLFFIFSFCFIALGCGNRYYHLHRRHDHKVEAFLRKERAKAPVKNSRPIPKDKPNAKRGYWGEPL